jgi:hypothetical protein
MSADYVGAPDAVVWAGGLWPRSALDAVLARVAASPTAR